MVITLTKVLKLHKTVTQNKTEREKLTHNVIERKAELLLCFSAALLESVQKVVSVWTQVKSVDGQPLQLSGGDTARPPLPSCLRREAVLSSECVCLCLSVRHCVWYSHMYVWSCVFGRVCVLSSRPGSSNRHRFRFLRLRRWAALLGRGSHSAIILGSGWSSLPAPQTHTEPRPWS